MHLKWTFRLCCGAVLVSAFLVHCKRGPPGQSPAKGSAVNCSQSGGDTFTVRAGRLARKKGYKIACKKNEVIAHLEVAGHNGNCQGLTPDLFVQVNLCLWKRRCRLRYTKNKGKYMLKVLAGPKPKCAVTEADRFTISYGCAKGGVKLLDVISEELDEFGETVSLSTSRVASPPVEEGILRSHKDFPWHYRPTLEASDQYHNLTLTKPHGAAELKFFVYTVRSLKISHSDRLTVTGADGDPDVFNDQVDASTFVMDDPVDVTFSLRKATESLGGEGFLICFKWQDSREASDVCKSVIRPKCRKKQRGSGSRNGGNKKRPNRTRKGRQKTQKNKGN